MTMDEERFLVTGAGGCIGSWVVRLLLDQGVHVVATDLSEDLRRFRLISHPGRPVDVEFLSLDVTVADAVAAAITERRINRVVHLAGLQVPFCAANPPLGALVNVVGTVNVFEAVRVAGPRVGLAYASSAAIFGPGGYGSSGMVGDTSLPLPESHYGVYKVANEGTARIYSIEHGVGSVGLRPFVVYGPGRDQGMTSDPTKAMLAAAAGVSFHIKFGGNLLLTHAADCAAIFIAAARAAVGSGDAVCCNVPGQRVGVAALVTLIDELVPEAAGLITHECTPLRVPALLESPTLGSVIGTVPNRTLREGVEATIAHFRRALSDGVLETPRP